MLTRSRPIWGRAVAPLRSFGVVGSLPFLHLHYKNRGSENVQTVTRRQIAASSPVNASFFAAVQLTEIGVASAAALSAGLTQNATSGEWRLPFLYSSTAENRSKVKVFACKLWKSTR